MIKINNESKMIKEYIEKLEEIIDNFVNKNTELDLDGLEQIKVVDNIKNVNSDGRFENDVIILPIIGNNEIRNFIEHIDEKDEMLMKMGLYNGSFNVIDNGMNQQTKKDLLNSEKKQNNLLNLLSMEYKILTVNNKNNVVKECTLDLIELNNELKRLKKLMIKYGVF